jgi:hypothetical protein
VRPVGGRRDDGHGLAHEKPVERGFFVEAPDVQRVLRDVRGDWRDGEGWFSAKTR